MRSSYARFNLWGTSKLSSAAMASAKSEKKPYEICNETRHLVCSGCIDVSYCSIECQQADRKNRKIECDLDEVRINYL
jgi:hypothetical protein